MRMRNLLIFLLLFPGIFSACTQKMSLEEARKVSISIAEEPAFAAPPRRIDDILSILNQPGRFASGITEKFKTQADAITPDTKDPGTLKRFYQERGEAAYQLGRYHQARDDFQRALGCNINHQADGFINARLGIIEEYCGNFEKAIELSKKSLSYRPYHSSAGQAGAPVLSYLQLAGLYSKIGDVEAAKKARQRGASWCQRYAFGKKAEIRFWCDLMVSLMDAKILEAQGNYDGAEAQYRRIEAIGAGPGHVLVEEHPRLYIENDMMHVRILGSQGRFLEAEVLARKVLAACLAHTGKESVLTGQALTILTRCLQGQGRLEEARRLSDEAIRVLTAAGVTEDTSLMGMARMFKGDNLAMMGDFAGAISQYNLAQKGMKDNRFLYEKTYLLNPAVLLSMVMTGRYEEAEKLASRNYELFRKRFGEQNENTAEQLAIRGMAGERLNSLWEAMQDLSAASAALMEHRTEEGEFLRHNRLRQAIVDDYIGLLAKIQGTSLEKDLNIDAAESSFRLAEASRSRNVGGALLAGSARAAVTDADLADLIRKEQDAGRQILILESVILDLMAAPADQQDPRAVRQILENINNLRSARNVIREETKKRFPQYADFIQATPPAIASLQGLLRPREVLLSFYITKSNTFIWVIPQKGRIIFNKAGVGRNELFQTVAALRKSLDPKSETLGDIPDFDVSLAYNLYTQLFSPVESAWKDATDLFMVLDSPLDQLPMAILPTAPFQLASERGELFARYRQVPWLIRKVSITLEPSVSALVKLRSLAPGDPGRKAFLGFGDPLFNRQQLASSEAEQRRDKERTRQEERPLQNILTDSFQVRGIRITEQGTLDNQKIASIHSSHLNRLPDTADEINDVARILKADMKNDVFLREQASEDRVKTMTLSDRKVIAFATHALVPGDLDGLDQPALALSSPTITGDREDGLLTMKEIMKLKLNTDWIVLSACNTGAANGAGAEALSGLGQAFFYAGSRAILASMYPVETTSARRLITDLFQRQVRDDRPSRAQSLRESMLNLMDRETMKDPSTGKFIASYAHPLFWAPFVLMGDPGP